LNLKASLYLKFAFLTASNTAGFELSQNVSIKQIFYATSFPNISEIFEKTYNYWLVNLTFEEIKVNRIRSICSVLLKYS